MVRVGVGMKCDVMLISSVGGHLTQLTQLFPLMQRYKCVLVSEKLEATLSLKKKYERVEYLVYGTKEQLFTYLFKFSFNILKSFYLFFKYRPKVIITTGTHTAVPMCYIGKLFGSKVVFIESFAKRDSANLSGKMVYPIADLFMVQWESMLKVYPKAVYKGGVY